MKVLLSILFLFLSFFAKNDLIARNTHCNLQTSAFSPTDNWYRTFEWTDCWNRINPGDPNDPNNVSLNNCNWTAWEKRFSNVTVGADGTITVTGAYDTGEEGITAPGDPPFNPVQSFTHTYHPYDLIVFANKSSIESINEANTEGVVVVPALFLRFAYDKAFNQGIYDVALTSASILGILGVDEVMLASKVLSRVPNLKRLIKWIWRESTLTGTNVVRCVTKGNFKVSFAASNEIADQAWDLFKQEKWSELEQLFNANNINKSNGIIYPPNNGAINGIKKTLDPADYSNNLFIDRYGPTGGKFTAPANTPFGQRALPSSFSSQIPQKYKVIKPIPNIEEGQIIPWFSQPGMGTQFKLEKSVQYYIEQGYLQIIP